MTSTLWQSYHLAKEPFKKTLEKVEVLALVVLFFSVFFFSGGLWGQERRGYAYSIFLAQQVNFNALSAYSACSEQAAHQLEARIPPGHCKLFL